MHKLYFARKWAMFRLRSVFASASVCLRYGCVLSFWYFLGIGLLSWCRDKVEKAAIDVLKLKLQTSARGSGKDSFAALRNDGVET